MTTPDVTELVYAAILLCVVRTAVSGSGDHLITEVN